MTHQQPTEPGKVATEPAAVAEVVRVLLALAAGAGWLSFDNATLGTTTSLVSAVLSIALTLWTRRKVTSLAKPRNADGAALVPAAPPTTLAGS